MLHVEIKIYYDIFMQSVLNLGLQKKTTNMLNVVISNHNCNTVLQYCRSDIIRGFLIFENFARRNSRNKESRENYF